jgi:uncharacterized repeat protein (TIGR01451 family)
MLTAYLNMKQRKPFTLAVREERKTMYGLKVNANQFPAGVINIALFATLIALLSSSKVVAQVPPGCTPGGMGASVQVTPTMAHIGDTITVTSVGANLGAANCVLTNGNAWLIYPDNSFQQTMTNVFLNPGDQTFCTPSGAFCLPFTTTYAIKFSDVDKNLSFTTPLGNGCVHPGQPKKVFFVAADEALLLQGGGLTASGCGNVGVTILFPCISITKNCASNCFLYGTPVSFNGTVSNTGDTPLSNIIVTDNPPATITFSTTTAMGHPFPDPTLGNFLVAGDSVNFTGSYTPAATGAGLCGPFTDTISATGQDPTGLTVRNTDACIDPTTGTSTGPRPPVTATCNVCNNPCVAVTKICPSVTTVNLSAPSYTVSGSVTNCGNVPLVNVVVTDNITNADGTHTAVTVTNIASLGIGQSVQLPIQTITPTICGPSTDQFTVTAQDLCPGATVAPASSQICTVTVVSTPCLAVTKICPVNSTVNLSSPAYTVSGFVTNCGTATMTNIMVTDTITNADGTHSTVTVTNISSLAAGASVALPPQTITPTLCGPSTDIFHVSGTDVCGNGTSANSQICTVTVISTPCLAVTKVCPASPTIVFGQSYSVSGFVTNCGTATMTNVVVVDIITDANGNKTTNSVTTISSLAAGAFQALPAQTITPTLCGPNTDLFSVSGTDVCGNGTTANSQNCTVTVVCTPCIGVTKLIACGPCGSNPGSLSYGPSATGVAGTNNPAFCYQIIVTNCGLVTLTNVQITDPTLGLTVSLPTNLPPNTATAPIFTGASFGVGSVTNTVTATGQSEATGQTVTTNASAVAIVVPASVTCKVDLSSSLNVNTNNSPPCEVTLPFNAVNSPVTVTLTITNTGEADLDVNIIGGDIVTAGLVNCSSGAAVTLGTVFVPAGGTTNFVVGCVAVSCPGTNLSAVVQGTAAASKSIPCVLGVFGNAITTAPSQCSQCVNCAPPPPPCIGVSKLIACGPCGSNPGSLSYGPSATGVAGTNNPAFCYQIIVTNCGGITLTNVEVSDPTLGLTFTLPTNLPPFTATAGIFTGASFGVGSVTNTVTATGQSEATGQTVTTNASAVAIVVPASVTCKLDLSSPVNQNPNNSPPCEVTLPPLSVNSPVTVTLTITNTGQADLDVNIVGGDILNSALFTCGGTTPVTFGTVFVPAGGTTNFVVGCVAVGCPGTNISAVVQGTAVASKSIPCVLGTSGNAITTAPSQCSQCVNCLTPPPCIAVSKLIACGAAGPNPQCNGSLSYGPTATGVAGTNNPAFCYQIIVTNCGGITLTNVQVSDPTLGLTFTLPTNLPPFTATASIFTGTSLPVGTHTNTVTVTGQSQANGQTTSAKASAVAIVVPASVTCNLSLSSSLNVNTNGSGACPVTLPGGTTNAPITVTITIVNGGQADLNVDIVGGNILTSVVFDCDFLTNVTFGTVFVPAGGTTNFVLGCVDVSCPGTNITTVVQGTAVASKSIPCVFDSSGNAISTATSQCSECVNCASGIECRVTGGGTLQPGATDINCVTLTTVLTDDEQCPGSVLDHISHGGQLGAPFDQQDCGQILGNPCIRGQWQHNRHYQGTGNPQDTINVDFHSFNANAGPVKGVFDTLQCACLGCCNNGIFIGSVTANALCNPDDHKICGPEPRPAPANAIIFTGLGVFSPADCGASGKKQPDRWFVFRVYIEDRSEPGGLHPGGAVEPADVYCFQAWDTGITVVKHSAASNVATAFRRCLAADSCAFIKSISTTTNTGVPPGTLPNPTVVCDGASMTADINDCGPLFSGNQQIHPSTGASCTTTTPLQIIP